MKREEFLDFVRYFPLTERLCGHSTPVLTEFEYARVHSSESDEWFKIPGNTFIIMFSATNSFSINVPIKGPAEFKYCFDNKNKDHVKFLLKFINFEIQQNVELIGKECLKLTCNYEHIKEIMIAIKCKEEMYTEMDNMVNKLLLA